MPSRALVAAYAVLAFLAALVIGVLLLIMLAVAAGHRCDPGEACTAPPSGVLDWIGTIAGYVVIGGLLVVPTLTGFWYLARSVFWSFAYAFTPSEPALIKYTDSAKWAILCGLLLSVIWGGLYAQLIVGYSAVEGFKALT
jgi:hypothetical protein